MLNNIGIIAYDDADLSVSLMNSLKMLLTYQFNDISRDYTTVADEAKFLESYLVLEKSRRENFDYHRDERRVRKRHDAYPAAHPIY